MPDNESAAERIMDKIMRWLGPLILAYLATLGTVNHGKIEAVEQKQQQTAEAAGSAADSVHEVKTAIDKRDAQAEKEAADQRKATAAMLYGNWKYLDSQAVTPEEIKEAANAKRRYEEFTNPKK